MHPAFGGAAGLLRVRGIGREQEEDREQKERADKDTDQCQPVGVGMQKRAPANLRCKSLDLIGRY